MTKVVGIIDAPYCYEFLEAVNLLKAEPFCSKLTALVSGGYAETYGTYDWIAECAMKLLTFPDADKHAVLCLRCLVAIAQNLNLDDSNSYLQTMWFRMDEAMLTAAVSVWVQFGGKFKFDAELDQLLPQSGGQPCRRTMQFMDDCTRGLYLQEIYTNVLQGWRPNEKSDRRLPQELVDMIWKYSMDDCEAVSNMPDPCGNGSRWRLSVHFERLAFDCVPQPWLEDASEDHPPLKRCHYCDKGRCGCFVERLFWEAKSRQYCVRPCVNDDNKEEFEKDKASWL